MDFQSTNSNISSMRDNLRSQFADMTTDMQDCIENCVVAAEMCERLLQHCLAKGGIHAEQRHVRILQDCAEICAMSARFMIRDSNLHHLTCQLCAEACLTCAQDCDRFSDDEMMRACVEVCRRCADSCEKMSTSH